MSCADRHEIEDLLSAYVYIVDDAAWDRLGEVFLDDATCDYETFGLPRMVGLDAIREAFREFRHPLAHHAVNVLMHVGSSGQEAVVRSKFILLMDGGKVWGGEYHDRLFRTAEGWRFSARVAIRPRQIPVMR